MKTFFKSIVITALILTGTVHAQDSLSSKEYFSFEEIYQQEITVEYATKRFNSLDGVQIAYYDFKPEKETKATLVFIHGGGASSSFLAANNEGKTTERIPHVSIHTFSC